MALDLPHAQASCVERDDFLVEAGPAGLVLDDDLRLERPLAVAGNVQRQRAESARGGLGAMAVAGVGGAVGHLAALVVAQVAGHLDLQGALHQHLGELLEQAVFADQVFGLLVVGQQAVGQFEQFWIGLGPLVTLYYGHCGSLMAAVSCQMTVYTKLFTPSVKIFPDAFDLDVGFVHAPAAADRAFVLAGQFLNQRQEANRPPVDRRMVNRHAALFHHLLEVPVAQRVGRIPADADQDHIDRKAHPFEVEHINSSRVRALKFTRLASRLSLMRQNPDIGIFTQMPYRDDLQVSRYRNDELVLIVPSAHPLATLDVVSFAQTLDYEFVGLHVGTSLNFQMLRAASELGR